jgi:hypothetical protein
MRESKSISEFNSLGEDRADIGEEGDKIDFNKLREAARKEKVKDEKGTKEEPKKNQKKKDTLRLLPF